MPITTSQRMAARRLQRARERRAELDGAMITRTLLDEDEAFEVSLRSKPHDYVLQHIREVSENARATWFGLIGLLAFCGVTLLGVEDQDFFAYGAETALPILGLTVPTAPFFVTAPFAVLAVYAYLHVYLVKLWRALAAAPAQLEGRALDELVFPWLLSDAALRWRRDRRFRRPFGWLTALMSWLLGWAAGPLILFAFWLRSAPAHHEGMTMYLGWLVLFSLWISWRSRSLARRAMIGDVRDYEEISFLGMGGALNWIGRVVMGFLIVIFFNTLSWEMTEGDLECPEYDGDFQAAIKKAHNCWFEETFPFVLEWGDQQRAERGGVLVTSGLWPANMIEAPLSVKPEDYVDRTLARDVYLRDYARGLRAILPNGADLPEDWELQAEEEFRAQRREYLSRIQSKPLENADLREAVMADAFMASIELNYARLDRAVLRSARLEGAQLRFASMREAEFDEARVDAANLSNGVLEQAFFDGAFLNEAQLLNAQAKEASFIGAHLENAQLDYADFTSANFNDADLSRASAVSATLTDAQLDQAILKSTDLSSANLRRASFWGADLDGAKLDSANLSGAKLDGVKWLTQVQLELAFGDAETSLPEGLRRPSHWAGAALDDAANEEAYLNWLRTRY